MQNGVSDLGDFLDTVCLGKVINKLSGNRTRAAMVSIKALCSLVVAAV
jgi:hypothetical protein